MGRRVSVTEYLELDVDECTWHCASCGRALVDAEENYKRGCLIHNRDPREIHNAVYEADFNFAPDPSWVRILEFYCPSCGTQIETEYLPPGHPVTHDINIDVTTLRARLDKGDLALVNKKLEVRS